MSMSCKPKIDWSALDFAGFARLAGDASLSKYEKIGFPDSYRAGFEAMIFADICAKLPRLHERDLTVLDIGPGCSDLPMMLIELCRTKGHRLCFVDSAEMLAQLPDAPFIDKRPGLFPKCRESLSELTGKVDVALCYSVLHYVFVDANELDRPYIGWKNDTSFRHKAFRCMVRVKFNPGLPFNFTIMKHTGWIATERSVKAHESRPDGRALAADTGYQASYRYGSHQSITRNWMMPMHQTDTLFHKRTGAMAFVFGFDVDNHAINTVPKETLVRVTKAEPGGLGGVGVWKPATSGFGPSGKTDRNERYLNGALVRVE